VEKRWLRQYLVLLVASCLSIAAHAWGEVGHRVTGLVANEFITDTTRRELQALMGSTDLATMALYMDKNKMALQSRIPGSREWHYDDRPVCNSKATRAEYCPGGNCSSVQIRKHYRILIDPHSSKGDRQFAVYVLVHLIGDIHQPLHASDHDDRGGNDVKVTLPTSAAAKLNLHSVWDNNLVAQSFDVKDERKIAKQLFATITDAQRQEWKSVRIDQWLSEGYLIAVNDVYGKLPGFSCQGDLGADPIALDMDYVKNATAIIPTQLLKAGYRIAAVLNRALDR